MTRKNSLAIVYVDELSCRSLEWIVLKPFTKYSLKPNTPHAIVRDRDSLSDKGIVIYAEENGLPFYKSEHRLSYFFWRDFEITRAIQTLENY